MVDKRSNKQDKQVTSHLKQLLSQSFDINASLPSHPQQQHYGGIGMASSTFDHQEGIGSQSQVRKLQSQIRDLEQSLALNKEILNKILSSNDTNHSLVAMIKEMQQKNTILTQQVQTLSFDKESLQTFANQQASELMGQIKQLQEQTMNDQEKTFMKEQIMVLQQRLSEKETQFIKLDNEYKKKKKECEKLEIKLDQKKDLIDSQQATTTKVNQSFDVRNKVGANVNSIDFEELMNTSIDMITKNIQNKHCKSKERSPSVPKLNFQSMKEFQEQDWLSYAHKLEDSIKVLNQRIGLLEEENDQATLKYHKAANQNTKLYELNEKLNQAMKSLKLKVEEVKKFYKEKLKQPKECSFCNNQVEMNLSNFTMTYDKVNVSFDAATNTFTTKNSFMQQQKDQMQQQQQQQQQQQTQQNQQHNKNTSVYSHQGDLQQFMNEIDNSKLDLSQQEVHNDSFVGKPKILKDSSKYIKKMPPQKISPSPPLSQQPPLPLNNIIQSVQEGLSQILNPSQTFYGNSSSNGGSESHGQTPTFNNQHVPKILNSASTKMNKMQQHFMNQSNSRNQDPNETEEFNQQKQQQQQLQEQFIKYYVSPQNSSSNTGNQKQSQNEKPLQQSKTPIPVAQRSASDAKNPPPIQVQLPSSGGQKSQQNSKERLKQIMIGDDIIKIKRINKKKQSVTNRNSPSNANSGAHHSNIIGNIMNVFERKKRNL